MQSIDTLVYPRWIVPIEPDPAQVLENHALAMDKGKIIEILPSDMATQKYQAKNTHKLPEHVVLPGLINTHTHSAMSLFRGMIDDYALTAWNNIIWPIESRVIREDFVRDGTELAMLEMLRSGTTCFNEHYFLSDTLAQTAADAKMRAMIGTLVYEVPTMYAKSSKEYLIKMQEFYQGWNNHDLIKVCIAPHGPHTVDDTTFIKIKEYSDEHQLKVHIHLLESQNEIQHNLNLYGKRPLPRLRDLGLVNDRLMAAHMIYADEEDYKILEEHKPHILHLPESNLKLASGFCPVEKYRELGLNVALGTDGAASNNDLDLMGDMRTAALIAKALTLNPLALNAVTALQMATINGAKALGWADHIGSLLPGKAADIIAIDMSAINTQPVYNLISQIVYAANSRQVSNVWIAGTQVLENGNFKTLDAEKILHKATKWSKELKV